MESLPQMPSEVLKFLPYHCMIQLPLYSGYVGNTFAPHGWGASGDFAPICACGAWRCWSEPGKWSLQEKCKPRCSPVCGQMGIGVESPVIIHRSWRRWLPIESGLHKPQIISQISVGKGPGALDGRMSWRGDWTISPWNILGCLPKSAWIAYFISSTCGWALLVQHLGISPSRWWR